MSIEQEGGITPFMEQLVETGQFAIVSLPENATINAAYGTTGLSYDGVTLVFAEGDAGGVAGVSRRKDQQLPAMRELHDLGIPFVNVVSYRGAAGIGGTTSVGDLGQMITLPLTTLADVSMGLEAVGRILKTITRVPDWKLLKYDPRKDLNDPKVGFITMLDQAISESKKEA